VAFGTQSIIISGGIQAGPSFALAQGLFVSIVSPATASSSPSVRLTAGPPDQIEIGPSTTPHATVIGFAATVPVGGNGSQVVIGTSTTTLSTQDDVIIGHGANAPVLNNGGVAIGVAATIGVGAFVGGVAIGSNSLAGNGVAIGASAVCALGQGQVAIGFSARAQNLGIAVGGTAFAGVGAAHGFGSIAIGRSASAAESTDIAFGTGNGGTTGAGGNILLGSGVGGTGIAANDVICIGSSSNTGGGFLPASATAAANFSTVIGGNSQAQHAGARLVGRGLVSTAANQTLIGGTDDPAATVIFGNGATAAAPQNVIVGVTGGTGNNAPGATHTVAGGISTGTAAGGSIVFQTTPAGGAGAVPNALVTALTIDSTGLATFAFAPLFTATTAPGAQVLTLTNGPAAAAAGAPQTYFTFKSTGHTYAVPAWQIA
jgi:hypothetical protein